jgi:hypothetical protein
MVSFAFLLLVQEKKRRLTRATAQQEDFSPTSGGPEPSNGPGFRSTHGKLLETIGRPGLVPPPGPHLSSTRPHVSAPTIFTNGAGRGPSEAAAAAAWPNPKPQVPFRFIYWPLRSIGRITLANPILDPV